VSSHFGQRTGEESIRLQTLIRMMGNMYAKYPLR
jgi:hypothetical protein